MLNSGTIISKKLNIMVLSMFIFNIYFVNYPKLNLE